VLHRRATLGTLEDAGAAFLDVGPAIATLSGLALQLLGTCIAAWGLVRTWHAYSKLPLVPWWGQARARVGSWRRWLLSHLPGPLRRAPQTNALAGHGEGHATAGGYLTTGWGPLPDDPEAALRAVDSHTRELLSRLEASEVAFKDAVDRVRRDLRLGLDEEAQERAESVRRLATEGLRAALVGFGFLVAGLLIQGAAVVWLLRA
jgi:hypothetical protein